VLPLRNPPVVREILGGQGHGYIILAGVHLQGSLQKPLVVISYCRRIVQRTGIVVRIVEGLWGRSIGEVEYDIRGPTLPG